MSKYPRFLVIIDRKFRDASDVPDMLGDFAVAFGIDLDLRVGRFEDTLPSLGDRQYCFAHIDCDTYRSHMQCLIALYDKLTDGGVIVFDDYGSAAWPGVAASIDDFFAGKPETIQVSSVRERPAWYAVKAAGQRHISN